MRGGEMTWKDIPWADPSKPTPIPEGTRAVVPELDADGDSTGNYLYLSHEEYVEVMGATAYRQALLSGDPDEILRKFRRNIPPESKISNDGVNLKPPVEERMKK